MTATYHFWGSDNDSNVALCLRIRLHSKPTIDELDHLLYDLYAERQIKPKYLLLSEKDLHFLSDDIRANMQGSHYSRLYHQLWATSDQIEDLLSTNFYRDVKRFNFVTGGMAWLAALPDLEDGTVIAGFYDLECRSVSSV